MKNIMQFLKTDILKQIVTLGAVYLGFYLNSKREDKILKEKKRKIEYISIIKLTYMLEMIIKYSSSSMTNFLSSYNKYNEQKKEYKELNEYPYEVGVNYDLPEFNTEDTISYFIANRDRDIFDDIDYDIWLFLKDNGSYIYNSNFLTYRAIVDKQIYDIEELIQNILLIFEYKEIQILLEIQSFFPTNINYEEAELVLPLDLFSLISSNKDEIFNILDKINIGDKYQNIKINSIKLNIEKSLNEKEIKRVSNRSYEWKYNVSLY